MFLFGKKLEKESLSFFSHSFSTPSLFSLFLFCSSSPLPSLFLSSSCFSLSLALFLSKTKRPNQTNKKTSNSSIYLERSPRHPGAATSVVARRDPQLPQGFTPIAEELTLWPGDRVTMTCVYDASGSDRVVTAGSTHNDEM